MIYYNNIDKGKVQHGTQRGGRCLWLQYSESWSKRIESSLGYKMRLFWEKRYGRGEERKSQTGILEKVKEGNFQ